jgi:hypothetical protein
MTSTGAIGWEQSRVKACCRWIGIALTVASGALPLAAASSTYTERMHHRALESFRQGRFPEAYGRFIDLANAGHPASARYALWMCEQGPSLFGKDWDCAPHEVEDWARLAGVAAPRTGETRLPDRRGHAQPQRRR